MASCITPIPIPDIPNPAIKKHTNNIQVDEIRPEIMNPKGRINIESITTVLMTISRLAYLDWFVDWK
jgi:hypothetical protein